MIYKSQKVFLFVSTFVLLLFSCKKEIKDSTITFAGNHSKDGVPVPPLDWENIDFMPMPPGTFTVGVPWGSGTSDEIPTEMLDDYKYEDGWRLVYNTFNTSTLPDNYYFMLYNVYRGLIRLYYYVPPSANYQFSDNIVHTLSIEKSYAASSPIMNFAGQNVVHTTVNSAFASTIEEAKVAPSTWYALQYELAYDKNMDLENFSTFSFDWNCRSTEITSVVLNGQVSGNIIGTINIPGSNFTIAPTFSVDASRGNITINGTSVADKLNSTLGSSIVNGIKSGITNGLQGILKNVLSGIFKRQENTEENVHLKIEADIELEGSLTTDFLITSPKFAIPGYDQASTVGYIPAYNEPLGVFYLNNSPTINITRTHNNTGDRTTSTTLYGFIIDNNSFQIEYNPAVTALAQIQNVETEIVLFDPQIDWAIGGFLETVGTTTIYTNVYAVEVPFMRPAPPRLGLRISFDVVPNNGAEAVKIAKTFHVSRVNQW